MQGFATLLVVFSAHLPCPVVGVAGAAARSARAVAAQEAVLNARRSERDADVRDVQGDPYSKDPNLDQKTASSFNRASGKLDEADDQIQDLKHMEKAETRRTAEATIAPSAASPTEAATPEAAATKENVTDAKSNDTRLSREADNTKDSVEVVFDDQDVEDMPFWKLYSAFKGRFQNSMVTAMMTATGDYAILYAALFMLGAWIILCLHRGKHQATRGIGTLTCVLCFLPCGVMTLCCPIDEYTPTDDELRPKHEKERNP